jgi:hypothetical protein
MKRIYHPYWLWEDYKHGFYENSSGSNKEKHIEKCLELFNSKELTTEFMFRVVNEWKYSCEHNLTNEAMNKIAYIGQSACCLFASIPNTITMECWSKLSSEIQKQANEIAEKALNHWLETNKYIQLCLSLD